MRKLISILALLSLLTSVLGTTVFAEGSKIDDKISSITERHQKIEVNKENISQKINDFKTKSADWESIKKDFADKKIKLMGNKCLNLDVRFENNSLRLQLTNALKAVKESGQPLPEATKTSLKSFSEQIKVISTAIKEKKGTIKELMTQSKELIKAKDYMGAQAIYDQIEVIQLERNDQLKKINSILSQMIALF